jgi:hypothetical protein
MLKKLKIIFLLFVFSTVTNAQQKQDLQAVLTDYFNDKDFTGSRDSISYNLVSFLSTPDKIIRQLTIISYKKNQLDTFTTNKFEGLSYEHIVRINISGQKKIVIPFIIRKIDIIADRFKNQFSSKDFDRLFALIEKFTASDTGNYFISKPIIAFKLPDLD